MNSTHLSPTVADSSAPSTRRPTVAVGTGWGPGRTQGLPRQGGPERRTGERDTVAGLGFPTCAGGPSSDPLPSPSRSVCPRGPRGRGAKRRDRARPSREEDRQGGPPHAFSVPPSLGSVGAGTLTPQS